MPSTILASAIDVAAWLGTHLHSCIATAVLIRSHERPAVKRRRERFCKQRATFMQATAMSNYVPELVGSTLLTTTKKLPMKPHQRKRDCQRAPPKSNSFPRGSPCTKLVTSGCWTKLTISEKKQEEHGRSRALSLVLEVHFDRNVRRWHQPGSL